MTFDEIFLTILTATLQVSFHFFFLTSWPSFTDQEENEALRSNIRDAEASKTRDPSLLAIARIKDP